MLAAKKQTAKEMLEAEIRQTRKNHALACFVSEGGSVSDDHGSDGGVPPEIAVEDAREEDREADRFRFEENSGEREREHMVEEAPEADRDDSSVEEVDDAFPHCQPLAD